MAYRNLSPEQFAEVKELAAFLCEERGLKTIGEYKRVGNEIIDEIESGLKKFVTDCKDSVVIIDS